MQKTSERGNSARGGFTLTEIMVTLSIISLLVPGILGTFYYFAKAAYDGVDHNQNIAEARHFEQFFLRELSGANRDSPVIRKVGTSFFMQFSKVYTNGTSRQAWFLLAPTSNGGAPLYYKVAGKPRKLLLPKASLPTGSTEPFSISNGVPGFHLVVGDKQPVEISAFAAPKNPKL